MSEYQYFEFQAVDRPLTQREMRALRRYSTRARITPTSFVNSYDWGNFKGDPREWMEKYFDAFLYVANWGTHALELRLPRRTLDWKIARRYCSDQAATIRATRDFVILEFASDDDTEGDWSDDGSGWLGSLIPLRADILGGDYRALYIGWLLRVQLGELKAEATEPPLPAGLATLTAPLRALVDFLRVDCDLVAAAAERSGQGRQRPPRRELRREIAALPEAEKTKLLLRLTMGEETRLSSQLAHRLRYARRPETSTSSPRTVAELLAARERRAEERERKEAEQAARERVLRERQEAAALERYLNGLRKRQTESWRKVEALIATRRPTEYDNAVRLLKDLRELAKRDGRAVEATARRRRLAKRHRRKSTLIGRLERARLI